MSFSRTNRSNSIYSTNNKSVIEDENDNVELLTQTSEYYRSLLMKNLLQNEVNKLQQERNEEILSRKIICEKTILKQAQLEDEVNKLTFKKEFSAKLKILEENINKLDKIQNSELKIDYLKEILEYLLNNLFVEDICGPLSLADFEKFNNICHRCLESLEDAGIRSDNNKTLHLATNTIAKYENIKEECENLLTNNKDKASKLYRLFLTLMANLLNFYDED